MPYKVSMVTALTVLWSYCRTCHIVGRPRLKTVVSTVVCMSCVRRNCRYAQLMGITAVAALFILIFPYLYQLFSRKEGYELLQNFHYPPNVDLDIIIDNVRNHQALPKRLSTIKPSNPRTFHFVLGDLTLCEREKLDMIILVKTTHSAFAKRHAIRHTWGNALCYDKLNVRVLFLLGRMRTEMSSLESAVRREQHVYGDLIQQNFVDAYYNNTLKLMMGFEYLSEHCPTARFLVLIDDDYLLGPESLSRYVSGVHRRLLTRFLAGYVWYAAKPVRRSDNKWYQSREAYPFEMFPTYAEAGTLIVSSEFARDLYVAMQYTQYHKFDDIFLGFILHKLHIAPVHCPLIFHSRPTKMPEEFVSSHGFDTGKDLISAWKSTGLAKKCAQTLARHRKLTRRFHGKGSKP